VEIYNEKIRDLLDISKQDLKVREDKVRGIFIEDITE
jgi:kinesin family protein 5